MVKVEFKTEEGLQLESKTGDRVDLEFKIEAQDEIKLTLVTEFNFNLIFIIIEN